MDSCFFCGAIDLNGATGYECATTAKVPSSQKTVSLVLTHLANCIKQSINLKPDTKVCPRCFYELSEYDTIMVNLMTTQKKLTIQLKAALKSESVHDTESVNESSLLGAETEPEPDDDMDAEVAADEEAEVQEIVDKIVQDDSEEFLVELVKEDDKLMGGKDDYGDDDEEYICEMEVPRVIQLQTPESDEKGNRKRIKQDCSACGKIFNSKYQLQKHISEVHTKQQSHVCPICGIVRRDEEYLELHMNLHEGKTEKQCRYCPKSFSRPVNTLRHMRMHWDKKKYQCEKCGLRFSQDNLLYNHRLRHEAEENPIICSVCNVSFKSRKTFNHHTLIHKENRPRHYCTVCPKSFTERYTLKMHMKTHESDVVFGVREEAPTDADEQQVVEELHVDVDESEQAVTVIMSDNDENSCFCVICSSNFESKKDLEHHLQFDHDVIFK